MIQTDELSWILRQTTACSYLAQGAAAATCLWIIWCINLVFKATKPEFSITSLPLIANWCYGNHPDLLTLENKGITIYHWHPLRLLKLGFRRSNQETETNRMQSPILTELRARTTKIFMLQKVILGLRLGWILWKVLRDKIKEDELGGACSRHGRWEIGDVRD